MQQLSPFRFLLFSFLLITACSRQQQPDAPNSTNAPASLSPLTPAADKDPYFVETQELASPYGPKSITRNVLQSQSGDIWLTTWQGILRYDGQTFTNLTNQEGLRRFHAFASLEDQQGNLWFTTIGAGVYRYDGKTFTNFSTSHGIPNDRVTFINEDRSGNIWLGTESGASRFDGKTFRNFTTKDGLLNNDVNTIIEDKGGKFWIGTRGHASYYDGKTFTAIKTEDGKPFGNVRSILEDSKGNIWLGGNDGLWKYDGSAFTQFTTSFTGYIYEDSRGDIWTSTAGNNSDNWILYRYNAQAQLSPVVSPTPIEPEVGMLFGITEDKQHNIWFGTLNGVGRYDGKDFEYFRE